MSGPRFCEYCGARADDEHGLQAATRDALRRLETIAHAPVGADWHELQRHAADSVLDLRDALRRASTTPNPTRTSP